MLSFAAGLIVARALGPSDYGDFNFLLVSFAAISRLLDMGASSAFYTFISRRQRTKAFYLYYIGWIATQFVFAVLLIAVLIPETMRNRLWLGHDRSIILLAFTASFTMGQMWEMMTSVGESIRKTVAVQMRNLGLSIAYILFILMLIVLNQLTVKNLFILHGILYCGFSILLFTFVKNSLFTYSEKSDSFKDVFMEFKEYCLPLLVTIWISFLYTFADRWMLQKFGGADQQGFYSVGEKFTAVCLIGAASILRVFWKETAEAFENRDLRKIKTLYLRTSRFFFLPPASYLAWPFPLAGRS